MFFGFTSETILQYSIIDRSVRQTHMTNISTKIEMIHSCINCYVGIFSVCAINCKFHIIMTSSSKLGLTRQPFPLECRLGEVNALYLLGLLGIYIIQMIF